MAKSTRMTQSGHSTPGGGCVLRYPRLGSVTSASFTGSFNNRVPGPNPCRVHLCGSGPTWQTRRKDRPRIWHALKGRARRDPQSEAGADDQILDGAGDEHLTGFGQGSPLPGRRYGPRCPGHFVAREVALPGVEPARISSPSGCTASAMVRAQRTARAGPSNGGQDAVPQRRPASCPRCSSFTRVPSPSAGPAGRASAGPLTRQARAVEPTMSVKSIVVSTRSASRRVARR